MSSFLTLLALRLLLLLQGGGRAIVITKLDVPKALAVGDSGVLECDWDDQGDLVYALKWYLGLDEFYRWTPLEEPEVKTFPSEHFLVDGSASQRGRVLIHNVTVGAGGNYRCEVSGEAPYFKTSFSTGILSVVDLPDEVPTITSKSPEPLTLLQQVGVTCLSRHALPAPALAFYLNHQPVESQWEVSQRVEVNASTGLESAIKHLEFILQPSMAPGGILKVKCVASHPDLYWESGERHFIVKVPHTTQPHTPGSQGFFFNSGESRTAFFSLFTTAAAVMVVVVITGWVR